LKINKKIKGEKNIGKGMQMGIKNIIENL